ncbi:hypothetical protein DFJ73DRAFT_773916 [Zopfochytrium polystomum]|nr:hypothetical protein DFJ73DRAFT_773916 [Zopfochytrium polystomum]
MPVVFVAPRILSTSAVPNAAGSVLWPAHSILAPSTLFSSVFPPSIQPAQPVSPEFEAKPVSRQKLFVKHAALLVVDIIIIIIIINRLPDSRPQKDAAPALSLGQGPKILQGGPVIVICASAPFLPRVESQPPPYDQIEPTLSSLGLHDGIVSDFMRDAVGSDVSPALAEFWELVRSFEDERTKLATGDGPTAAVKLEGSKLRFVEDAIWKKYLTFTLIDPSLSSIPHEVFSWILHVCANGRASASVDRVDSLVSDMDRSGIPLSATDNANLLTVWMRAQWVARRPEQCIEAAVERGLGMCMQLHREFLRHYFTDGTKRLVDELVLSLATRPTTTTTTETTPRAAAVPPSPATEVAEFCFRALGDIFDCDGVVGLHAELRPILWERGYSFTIGTYECILATLSHASHLKTPSFGFFPPMNGKTVSSSLHIAESIFREALSFYPADRRLYNLMLRAALRHTKTDLHSATRLLDEIVQLKITLPSASIAALAATYTRMGFTNELKLIWKGTLPALADLPPSVSSAAPIKLAQHVGAGTSATEEWPKVVVDHGNVQDDAKERVPALGAPLLAV